MSLARLPRLAIIGRPNVGKSSLTNMLAARKVSIVDPTPGVTRDRVTTVIHVESSDSRSPELAVELTDTGGYGIYTTTERRIDEAGHDLAKLSAPIEKQIASAVRYADVVLLGIDSQTGVTAQDQEVARLLREGGLAALDDSPGDKRGRGPKVGPRVVVVSNKVDGPRWEMHGLEASMLGFGEPMLVSARNNYRRREFTDKLFDILTDIKRETDASSGEGEGGSRDRTDQPTMGGRPLTTSGAPAEMMLAIVGKRNAGKSTLVNQLAGEERVIVSEIPGTTRDAIDVRFEMDDKTFVAIDTAGLRRKKAFQDRIEWFALDRLQRAVARSDVALFMIDATTPISQVDQQVGKMLTNSYKPVVIVVNKWDLISGRFVQQGRKAKRGTAVTPELYEQYIRDELKGLSFAPIAFISGATGLNTRETIGLAFDLMQQAHNRTTTGKLNRMMREIIRTRGPSNKLGTFARIYFSTQVQTAPPTIVCIVNKPELFDNGYQRFLMNRFREELPFPEVPIKLVIRARKKVEQQLVEGTPQFDRAMERQAMSVLSDLLPAAAYFDEPVDAAVDALAAPVEEDMGELVSAGGKPKASVNGKSNGKPTAKSSGKGAVKRPGGLVSATGASVARPATSDTGGTKVRHGSVEAMVYSGLAPDDGNGGSDDSAEFEFDVPSDGGPDSGQRPLAGTGADGLLEIEDDEISFNDEGDDADDGEEVAALPVKKVTKAAAKKVAKQPTKPAAKKPVKVAVLASKATKAKPKAASLAGDKAKPAPKAKPAVKSAAKDKAKAAVKPKGKSKS